MNRITTDPEQCGGRPCIRGMRIRVTDVLDLLSNGLTSQQVLEELPDLETDDVQACLQYASRKLNHPFWSPHDLGGRPPLAGSSQVDCC
jgi:uncharacterized protein (DUF433 family)